MIKSFQENGQLVCIPQVDLVSSYFQDLALLFRRAVQQEQVFINLVVDLSYVRNIDSTGVKLLLTVWKLAQEKRFQLKLQNLSTSLVKVFTVLGLAKLFSIDGTVENLYL
jgi:anti-anti-sigma factor